MKKLFTKLLIAFTISGFGQNLVYNGDFELGDVGFKTSYLPFSINPLQENHYVVTANPNAYHGSYSGKDHTTGSGKFFIANGSSVLNDTVWKQTVTVKQNTVYDFYVWACTVYPDNPAKLSLVINGNYVNSTDTIFAPLKVNEWEKYSLKWNSASNQVAEIIILNKNKDVTGNDFGLDDIVLIEEALNQEPVEVTDISGISNLIAYFPFNIDAKDFSGNNNDGISKDITYIDGKIGKSANFDGTASINFPVSQLNSLTSYSIAYWVKINDINGRQIIGNLWSPDHIIFDFNQNGDNRLFSQLAEPAGRSDIKNTTESTINTWYHCVHIQNSTTSKHEFYVNGILIGSKTIIPKLVSLSGGQLFQLGNITGGLNLKGQLDDFRVYGKALNNTEVITLFNYKEPVALPIVSNKSTCGDSKNLVAEGQNIKWYSDTLKTAQVGSGNTLQVNKTAAGSYTYWVTQTVNGVESATVKAVLTILPQVASATKPTTSAVSFCQGSKTTSIFSVTPVANANAYVWSISPSNAGTISGTTANATVTWNASFNGLAMVKVKGMNASCGVGQESPALNVSVLEAPAVAQNLQNFVEYCDGQFIVLNAGAGYDSYKWNTGSTEQIEVVKADFKGLGNHTYSVTVVEGTCSVTENIVITIDNTVAVKKPLLALERSMVQVYPNPSQDQLNLSFSNIYNENVLSVELIDELGLVQLRESVSVVEGNDFISKINLQNLDLGVYILKISGNTFVDTQSIMIK